MAGSFTEYGKRFHVIARSDIYYLSRCGHDNYRESKSPDDSCIYCNLNYPFVRLEKDIQSSSGET